MIALAPEPLVVSILALAIAFGRLAWENETLRDRYSALLTAYGRAYKSGVSVGMRSKTWPLKDHEGDVCDTYVSSEGHTDCRTCGLRWESACATPPVCMLKGNQAK